MTVARGRPGRGSDDQMQDRAEELVQTTALCAVLLQRLERLELASPEELDELRDLRQRLIVELQRVSRERGSS